MYFAPFNVGPDLSFDSISLCTLLYLSITLPLCSSYTVIVNTAIMDCVRLNYCLCRALGELWRNAVADKNASSSAPLLWC